MDKTAIDFYTRLARGLAAQFGSNCEIVIHDLESNDVEHSIVAIENGYITGRKLGDGPSHIVLESLQNGANGLPGVCDLSGNHDSASRVA